MQRGFAHHRQKRQRHSHCPSASPARQKRWQTRITRTTGRTKTGDVFTTLDHDLPRPQCRARADLRCGQHHLTALHALAVALIRTRRPPVSTPRSFLQTPPWCIQDVGMRTRTRSVNFALRGSAETTRPDQTFGPAHMPPATAPPILIAVLASAVILRIGGQIRSRNAFKVVLAAPPAHNGGVCKLVGAMQYRCVIFCTTTAFPIGALMRQALCPCMPPSIIVLDASVVTRAILSAASA